MNQTNSPDAVVIDANVLIASCAREATKLSQAEVVINEYAMNGVLFYAPGALIAEVLYILCKKQQEGVLGEESYREAIENLQDQMQAFFPSPRGDSALIARAEEIRNGYGCSHSTDSIYIALAEELAKTNDVELLTFDKGLEKQVAKKAPSVRVGLLVPTLIN